MRNSCSGPQTHGEWIAKSQRQHFMWGPCPPFYGIWTLNKRNSSLIALEIAITKCLYRCGRGIAGWSASTSRLCFDYCNYACCYVALAMNSFLPWLKHKSTAGQDFLNDSTITRDFADTVLCSAQSCRHASNCCGSALLPQSSYHSCSLIKQHNRVKSAPE